EEKNARREAIRNGVDDGRAPAHPGTWVGAARYGRRRYPAGSARSLPARSRPRSRGESEQLVIVGHTTRADPVSTHLTSRDEVLLVFQGPNGYISPAWYGEGTDIPTWNFTTVHVIGVPELLEGQEAFSVLARTVEHFEAARDDPWTLQGSSLEHAH